MDGMHWAHGGPSKQNMCTAWRGVRLARASQLQGMHRALGTATGTCVAGSGEGGKGRQRRDQRGAKGTRPRRHGPLLGREVSAVPLTRVRDDRTARRCCRCRCRCWGGVRHGVISRTSRRMASAHGVSRCQGEQQSGEAQGYACTLVFTCWYRCGCCPGGMVCVRSLRLVRCMGMDQFWWGGMDHGRAVPVRVAGRQQVETPPSTAK